jgi:hypothetical protein
MPLTRDALASSRSPRRYSHELALALHADARKLPEPQRFTNLISNNFGHIFPVTNNRLDAAS